MNLPAGLSSMAWRCLRRLGRRAGPVLAVLALPVVAAGPAPAPTPPQRPTAHPTSWCSWPMTGASPMWAPSVAIATPHLDDLARQVRSPTSTWPRRARRRARCCSPGSAPPRRVGNLRESMPREHLGRPGYLGSLNTRVVSVASLLQAAGYRTYISGKWNVAPSRTTCLHRAASTLDHPGRHRLGQLGASQRYLPHLGQGELVRGRAARAS